MEEIRIAMTNNTPFAMISKGFPDLTILRWCSSVIDYAEVYGSKERVERAMALLEETTKKIHSLVLSTDEIGDHTSTAISCSCSVRNSTIRLAESLNLLWEAPAVYEGGEEILRVISFSNEAFSSFFNRVSAVGNVRIIKKRKVKLDSLRDIYSISLIDLFGNLSNRQASYMRDAIGRGFFSAPKSTNLEDLARLHGISKSTMQEHLNKARNKLIRSVEPYLTLYLHSNRRN